jgi:HAD superfamily hydrolase (TIGR01549 family)
MAGQTNIHNSKDQMIDHISEKRNLGGLLFDLDGTLLDSFPAHFTAYRLMFARFKIDITEESFLSSYSPNWYHTYQHMGLPEESWSEANSYWIEEAEKQPPELFPGTRETLTRLRDFYRLGIVTSGTKSRVIRDLERTGIESFFEVLITGDDIKHPKPAPEGLHLALDKLGLQADESAYIGDAHADYEMALAAGVYFVGIPSAFANLKPDHPCFKVHGITDLVDVFMSR